MSFLHGTNQSVDPTLSNVNFARLFFRNSFSTVGFVIDTVSVESHKSLVLIFTLITVFTLMKKGTHSDDQEEKNRGEHVS